MSHPVIKLKPDKASDGGEDDYAKLMSRARALVPLLSARAAETERLRRLPPETLQDLHNSGLFRLLQPRRVGGFELDYVALIDFSAELARGDASVAWALANLGSHHWMLAMFSPEAQNQVWQANPDVLIASSFIFPAGRARRVAGGYRLSGHWQFSSGVQASDWNMLAAIISDEDEAEAVEYRIFLLHAKEYQIIETWDAAGLAGTGSQDIVVSDIFVSEAMSLALADLAAGPKPGTTLNPGALYQLPVFALFPFVLSGVALGNAEACFEDYILSAKQRASRYNRAMLADFQSTQIKIAEAGAKIDAARSIMRSACIDAMNMAREGYRPDMLTKTRYRRDGAFAVTLCTEAVALLFAASGAGGLSRKGRLQRQFRDAHAVNSHIAFNFDAAGANFGRVALGFSSENPTL